MTDEELKVLARAASPGGIDVARLLFCRDAPEIARDLHASGLLERDGYTYRLTEIGRTCLTSSSREARA